MQGFVFFMKVGCSVRSMHVAPPVGGVVWRQFVTPSTGAYIDEGTPPSIMLALCASRFSGLVVICTPRGQEARLKSYKFRIFSARYELVPA